MKLPARIVAWVLPLFLTGCFLHKTPTQPAQPLAPKLENSSVPPPTQQPPPEVTIPTQQPVSVTKLPEQTPKPLPKHKKPPANPPPDVQQASVGTPAVTAYAAGLGEFGAVITFAANVPGVTSTLPLALYTAMQSPDGDAMALRLAGLSFLLGLVGLLAAGFLVRR